MSVNLIQNLRKNAVFELIKNGISQNEALIEVDMMLQHFLGIEKKDLFSCKDIIIDDIKVDKLNSAIKKRIKENIPVQYLINKAFFMGKEFFVNKDVLIPRPETELLVEEVISILKKFEKNSEPQILDIGTGSGCIACMIAKLFPASRITAVDISHNALEVAQKNAINIGVGEKIIFKYSDICSKVTSKYDVIVSNPPYIPISEEKTLQREVLCHEPHIALFSYDEKGIDFYRKIACEGKTFLNIGGYLAFEVGYSQSYDVENLLKQLGYKVLKVVRDFCGIDRVIISQYVNKSL